MCLENIIGISNRNCDCVEIGEGLKVSTSGYFVDDIFEGTPLFQLQESLQCDDELIPLLENAISKAISDFKTDLNAKLAENNSKVMVYDHTFGKLEKAIGLVLKDYNKCGISIIGRPSHKKKSMTIHFVGLKTNASETVTVGLFKDSENNPIETWEIVTTQGNHSVNKKSKTVPLFDNVTGLAIEYRLLYTRTNTTRPYNTQSYCCNSIRGWNDYVNFRGYSESNEGSGMYHQKLMLGLTCRITFHCNEEWMCQEWNFDNDPWAKSMAKTIQLMAMMNIYKYVINSNEINRFTLQQPEAISMKMKELTEGIEWRMNYLSNEIPDVAQDCWQCNPRMWVGDAR